MLADTAVDSVLATSTSLSVSYIWTAPLDVIAEPTTRRNANSGSARDPLPWKLDHALRTISPPASPRPRRHVPDPPSWELLTYSVPNPCGDAPAIWFADSIPIAPQFVPMSLNKPSGTWPCSKPCGWKPKTH